MSKPPSKTALITGITGQDGSYLAELLLSKGYQVHGIIRRCSSFNTERIDHIYGHERLSLHYGDLTDGSCLSRILRLTKPHEVYNLGAQSHVKVSFDQPVYTCDVDAIGALNLLEAVRDAQDLCGHQIKVYQAGSSEMYGDSPAPQSEDTPFRPRSPYACAKVFAQHAARNYRDAYGMFIACGILFNHESPRRGETFVTRKITRALGRIKHGLQDRLILGNLDAKRDWGFAGDYMRAAWMMLQQDIPDDYVIATGQTRSVREFLSLACDYAGVSESVVGFDERYLRPTEVDVLCGDASKARRVLGWEPTVSLDGFVRMMVDADMAMARGERAVKLSGDAA